MSLLSGSVTCKHTAEVITRANHMCSSCVPLRNQEGMGSDLRGGGVRQKLNSGHMEMSCMDILAVQIYKSVNED